MVEMLSNIYDRLYFIQKKIEGVEIKLDSLERSVGKSRRKRLNTFYGKQKKKWTNWLKSKIKRNVQ